VNPCRLLDTRRDGGPVRPGSARRVAVGGAGSCNLPSDAFAIEATITVVKPEGGGYLRAYASGYDSVVPAFVNYVAGEDASNTGSIGVTPEAPKGLVLRTYLGAADVVIDVQGYYRSASPTLAGNLFVSATPCRSYDSRTDGARRPLAVGERRDLAIVGKPGCAVPGDAVAVETTVTAVDSPGSGFLRVFPSDRGTPNATFLTHVGGRSTTNTGTVEIDPGTGHPNLSVRNFGTATHVVVEVQGWWVPAPAPPASVFRARIPPCRILDTRKNGGPLAPGELRPVQLSGIHNCYVPVNAVAVEITISAVGPEGSGFLRVRPGGGPSSTATFLTFPGHQSTSNTGAVAIRPGPSQPNLDLRNYGSTTDYIIEVQGWYVPTE
jgi:hypothetical protein